MTFSSLHTKTQTMRVLLIAFAAFIFSSCRFLGWERIHGNSHITSQQKDVGSFNGVHASGSMDVHIIQSESNWVKIEADENLLPYIKTYVEGNVLMVHQKRGYDLHSSKGIVVYVSSPVFKEIRVSGSGDITSDNTLWGDEPLEISVSGSGNINMKAELPKLEAHVSGSGNLNLKGQVTDLNISMSGSGNSKCFELISDNVSVHISGSADVEVTANKKLDVNVSGSGDVRYKGNPVLFSHTSGSGDVQKVS